MYIPKRKGYKTMKFIENKTVNELKGLTKTSIQKLENKHLGVLKRTDGTYMIIKECGFGAGIDEYFKSTKELNEYVKRNF